MSLAEPIRQHEPIVPRVLPFIPAQPSTRASRRFPTPDQPGTTDDVVGLSIGDLDLFRTRLGPLTRMQRSPASQQCLLLARASEPILVSARGRRLAVSPQQLLVVTNTADHLASATGRRATVSGIILPTSLLSEFAVQPPRRSLEVHPGSTLAPPMWQFVDSLLDQPLPWQSLSAYFAEKLLHEMVGSVLLETAAVPGVPFADRSLVERARHHITAYARDPRLSPMMVARSLGVPLRRLQRRFAEVDSSLAAEIRSARATAAIAVLRSPEGCVLDIATVARVSGYPSDVALRRAFASLGLEPPSHYRRTQKQAR